MKPYTVTLHDGAAGELRVSAQALRDVLDALIDGARLATRFAVEGTSRRPGTRPAWLDSVCAIDVTGLRAGSTVLAHEAPTLAEAAPDVFGEPATMFDRLPDAADSASGLPRTDWTALDYFGTALASAAAGDAEHVVADRPLLEGCMKFLAAAPPEVDRITIEGVADQPGPIEVPRSAIATIERLRNEIPPPRAVRLAGVLDTISETRQAVILRLASGERIKVWLFLHNPAHLQKLFGQRVVVSGNAYYRPNGKLRQIEAETLDEAREQDSLFDEVPPPPELQPVVAPQPQDETTGVAAFFGTWVGDETDQDILDAVREMK